MAKRDINLFRAAGGERAKASKSSPVSIMLVIGLIVIVIALGVAVYFNMQVNSAKTDYEKKLKIQTNYQRTLNSATIKELSKEYNTVKDDIESAAAINEFVETRSALYPAATDSEIATIKSMILDNPVGETYSLNEPLDEDEEEETIFVPRDYEGLRSSLYEVEDFSDKELFYYALQNLAKKQEESEENVWYAYYRCYFVAVFTGGDGLGIPRLISSLATPSEAKSYQSPFCRYQMDNDVFDDGYYVPAKFQTVSYGEENYNILLLPLKTVVERAYDILAAHANALVEANGWQGQTELAEFGMDKIEFTNESLIFTLILPKDASFSEVLDEFDASYFFDVDKSVTRPNGENTESGVAYPIVLKYKNRPVFNDEEE